MKYFLVYWLYTAGTGGFTGTVTAPPYIPMPTIEACRAALTDMDIKAREFGGPTLVGLCVKG